MRCGVGVGRSVSGLCSQLLDQHRDFGAQPLERNLNAIQNALARSPLDGACKRCSVLGADGDQGALEGVRPMPDIQGIGLGAASQKPTKVVTMTSALRRNFVSVSRSLIVVCVALASSGSGMGGRV